MTDYTVKIKGDISDLIKKAQKANSEVQEIGKDEVKIRLNFENGNIEDLQKLVQSMIDQDEGLRVQLNFDLQSEALRRAKDELTSMEDLQQYLDLAINLDVSSIDSEISDLTDQISSDLEKGIDPNILKDRLRRVLDIARSVSDTKNIKGESIQLSDDTLDYLDKLTEKLKLDYDPKNTFFNGLNNQIKDTQTLIDGLEIQLEKLKKEGAMGGHGGTGEGTGNGEGDGKGDSALDQAVDDARQYAQDARDAADEARQSADDAQKAAQDALDAVSQSSSQEARDAADEVKETTENMEELARATQAQADAQEEAADSQQKLNDALGQNGETSTAQDEVNEYISTLEKLQDTLKQIGNFDFKIVGSSNENLGKNIEGTFKVYQQTLKQIDALEKQDTDGSLKEQIALLKNYAVAQREAIESAFPEGISKEDFLSQYTHINLDDLFGEEAISQFEQIKSAANDFKNSIISSITEITNKIDEAKKKASTTAPEIQKTISEEEQVLRDLINKKKQEFDEASDGGTKTTMKSFKLDEQIKFLSRELQYREAINSSSEDELQNIKNIQDEYDGLITQREHLADLEYQVNKISVDKPGLRKHNPEAVKQSMIELKDEFNQTMSEIKALEESGDDSQEIKERIVLLYGLAEAYAKVFNERIPKKYKTDQAKQDWLTEYVGEDAINWDIFTKTDSLYGEAGSRLIDLYSAISDRMDEIYDQNKGVISTEDHERALFLIKQEIEARKQLAEQESVEPQQTQEDRPEFIDNTSQIESETSAHRDATDAIEEHNRAEQELNNSLSNTPEFEDADEYLQSQANADAANEEAEAQEKAADAYRDKADAQRQLEDGSSQSEKATDAAREEAEANKEAAKSAREKAKAEEQATKRQSKTKEKEPLNWRVNGIKSEYNALTKTVGSKSGLTAEFGDQIDEFQKKIQSITAKTTNEELDALVANIRDVASAVDDLNIDKIEKGFLGLSKQLYDLPQLFKNGGIKEGSFEAKQLQEYSNQFLELEQRVKRVGEVFGENSEEYRKASDALKVYKNNAEQTLSGWMESNIESLERKLKNADIGEDQQDKVKEAQEAIDSMKNIVGGLSFDDVFKADKINSFVQQLGIASDATQDFKQKVNDLATETQVNKLFDKVSRDIEKNHLSGDLLDQYKDLQNRLRGIAEDTDDVADGFVKISKTDFKGLVTEWTTLHRQMIETGQTGKTFFDRVGEAMTTQGAAFIARYFSFQDYIRYARELIQTVTTLDTSLKELQKLTGASDSVMAQSFQHASETAQKYGATIESVIDSTSDWKRLGYTLSESEDLAKVTTLYQNIANGIDQQNASEYMVSILQGFQMDASDSMKIVDAVNEVAQNYAIDQQGIGEALQRSAAAFNAAHTDLNKSIALVTAANETLQNPEKVGTQCAHACSNT